MDGRPFRDRADAGRELAGALVAYEGRPDVVVLGLELVLDEAEGYAYLRQRAVVPGEVEMPRLIARRQLGYAVSLLLSLLRKKLAEFDAGSGESRLILSTEQIADMARLFLADTGNEAKLIGIAGVSRTVRPQRGTHRFREEPGPALPIALRAPHLPRSRRPGRRSVPG